MTLRLAGAVLVVGSLALMGRIWAAALHGRLEELRGFRAALTTLRSAVSYARYPAPDALEQAAAAAPGPAAASLRAAAQMLRTGRGPASAGAAWWEALEAARPHSCLTPSDRTVLFEVCLHLGKVDAATQLGLLDDAVERLKLAAADAQDAVDRLARLYRFSGLAAGLSVAILLW